MSTTLEAVQLVLINRLRVPMEAVGLDTGLSAALNSDLADPLTWALRSMSFNLADSLSVTTEEIATLSDDEITELLDLAEYRLLKTIVDLMNVTDERLGPHGKWASQYPTRLLERLSQEEKRIQRVYGIDASTISFGAFDIAAEVNVS